MHHATATNVQAFVNKAQGHILVVHFDCLFLHLHVVVLVLAELSRSDVERLEELRAIEPLVTLLDRFRVFATLDESHLLQLLALSFPFLAVFEQREDLCAFPSWTGANDHTTSRLLLVLCLKLVKIL